ncbi:hypothetical protein Bca101_021280 [Brassica carinata]
MDMISQLSDDLLIQILSLVPMKQVIMATCCLSKRWLLLWSLLPELYYDDISYGDENYAMFTQFVYRSLMSNKAPVLESLYFDLGHKYQAIDVANWIETAVVCHRVKAITVNLRENGTMISLPRSMLYTCETLEALHLFGCFRLDIPFSVCLPSLKNLALGDVDYADNKESSLTRLLSGCPNIETLFLSMYNYSRDQKGSSGFVIDVPSLRGLYIRDDFFDGMIFRNLVDLTLYTCAQGWWDLVTHMLQDSPKLRSLKLNDEHYLGRKSIETPDNWKRPSSVPMCLLHSFEFFKWNGYKGRRGDVDMATYLLTNATRLKKSIFLSQPHDDSESDRIHRDLYNVQAASPHHMFLSQERNKRQRVET